MEASKRRPPSVEFATAVVNRQSSRLFQQSLSAKEKHARAMKDIVLNGPNLSRGLSVSRQRETALQDIVHSASELAPTADRISATNSRVVASQMAELPPRVQAVVKCRHQMRRASKMQHYGFKFIFNPAKHSGANIERPLLIDDGRGKDDVQLHSTVQEPSRHLPRGQAPAPVQLHQHQPMTAKAAHVLPRTHSNILKHPQVSHQKLRLEPIDRSGTCVELAIDIDLEDSDKLHHNQAMPSSGAVVPLHHPKMATVTPSNGHGDQPLQNLRLDSVDLLGTSAELAIDLDIEDDDQPLQLSTIAAVAPTTGQGGQLLQRLTLNPVNRSELSADLNIDVGNEYNELPLHTQAMPSSGAAMPLHHIKMPAVAPASRQGNQPHQDLRWHCTGPAIPLQHSIVATVPPVRPLTKKERKAAAKAAQRPSKVLKPHCKKKGAQQQLDELKRQVKQQKKQEKKQEKKQPSRSTATWKAPIGAQVSQVRQHLFARAKDEMHVGRRSYPVVIEALQGVIAHLKDEASLYQVEQRVPPKVAAPQPRPEVIAPPIQSSGDCQSILWPPVWLLLRIT